MNEHRAKKSKSLLDAANSDLTFWSSHQKSVQVDLTEFARGSTGPQRAGSRWGGNFTGRPDLLRELLPYVRSSWVGLSPGAIQDGVGALRVWWRILDEAESPDAHAGRRIARVTSVADLNDLHAALARKKQIGTEAHQKFVRLVNLCRTGLGLPPVFWPRPERDARPAELPEYWEIEKIRHQLKRRWFAALDRWAALDRLNLEQAGANSSDGFAATGIAAPPRPAIGHHPIGDEVRSAFHLVLLASGWNAQTVLDIDLSRRFIEPHPTNAGYHIVYGIKAKGNSEHFVVGRDKRSDSPGTILRALIERTEPLRARLRRELSGVESGLEFLPNNTRLRTRSVWLRAAIRSPWLFVHEKTQGRIAYLQCANSGKGRGRSFLELLIRDINSGSPADAQVRATITASDFRDAYVGFAYEFSNYNILSAKIAATHRHATSTQHYLRQRQWRAHSAKKIHHFTQALWQEIEQRQSVDPAILRGLVERGEVSEEQRVRWEQHKDRTRVGVGCKDFRHPPAHIAPRHVEGAGCRVQRCTLCEHAVVFADSLDHLARRRAELEVLRTQIPVPSWTSSSFPEELDATEAVLGKFDKGSVADRVAHWHEQIRCAAHRPPGMEGSYD